MIARGLVKFFPIRIDQFVQFMLLLSVPIITCSLRASQSRRECGAERPVPSPLKSAERTRHLRRTVPTGRAAQRRIGISKEGYQ